MIQVLAVLQTTSRPEKENPAYVPGKTVTLPVELFIAFWMDCPGETVMSAKAGVALKKKITNKNKILLPIVI